MTSPRLLFRRAVIRCSIREQNDRNGERGAVFGAALSRNGHHRTVVGVLAILFAAGCGASLPQPEFERFEARVSPSPEEYPDVGGVVLLDRGTLFLTVDPARAFPIGRLRRYRRVKVLRASGATLGHIVVPYNPGEVVYGLIVRAVGPNGDTVDADVGETTDELDEARGRRLKRLDLPAVPPGSIVEYTYDLYVPDLRFVEPWVFESELPTVRSEYAVVAPPGFEVDVRYTEDGEFVDRAPERFDTPEGTRFFWSVSDVPARFDEPGMPSRDLLAPRAHVIFLSAQLANQTITGFRSWDDVEKWFVARVPEWASLPASMVAEAKRVAGEVSVEEKALKLQEVIAKDLGWEAQRVPMWRANLPPPEEVLRSKVGNRSSRGLLLTALLRAAGIQAFPALVATREDDVISPDAATVVSLTGVVAVVPRPEGLMVLDPSQLTVSESVPSPGLQGTRMVVLRDDIAEVVKVPPSKPDSSTSEITYTLELDKRGDLFGSLEAVMTGAEAGELRGQLSAAEPEDYAQVVSSFLRMRGGGLPVESVSIADLNELRRPLTIKGNVNEKALVTGEETEVFVRVGRLVGRPEETLREVRRSPLVLGVPRQVHVVVRVTLPEDWTIGEALPQVSQAWSGGQIDISMRSETRRRFAFLRTETRTAIEVGPRSYPEYRRFREDVRVAEDQVFAIQRPPPKTLEY